MEGSDRMNKAKEYTPKQLVDAERMCKLINKIPAENRTFVSAFMLAYMSGMEAGIMYVQESKATT